MDTITAEQVRDAITGTAFAASTRYEALPAAEQRAMWGAVPFGRKPVKHIPKRGGIEVQWRTLSRDWCYQFFTYEQIARSIRSGKAIEVQR